MFHAYNFFFIIIFCQEIVGLKDFVYFHKRQLHVWLIALQNSMNRGKGKNDVCKIKEDLPKARTHRGIQRYFRKYGKN